MSAKKHNPKVMRDALEALGVKAKAIKAIEESGLAAAVRKALEGKWSPTDIEWPTCETCGTNVPDDEALKSCPYCGQEWLADEEEGAAEAAVDPAAAAAKKDSDAKATKKDAKPATKKDSTKPAAKKDSAKPAAKPAAKSKASDDAKALVKEETELDDNLKAIHTLRKATAVNLWDIGDKLRTIKTKTLFAARGHRTFNECCQENGLDPRWAAQAIKVRETYKRTAVEGLPMTQITEIPKALPDPVRKKVLKQIADGASVREVRATVKEEMAAAGKSKTKSTSDPGKSKPGEARKAAAAKEEASSKAKAKGFVLAGRVPNKSSKKVRFVDAKGKPALAKGKVKKLVFDVGNAHVSIDIGSIDGKVTITQKPE